ncbi:hypothetical protein JHS3_20780 [Jeongeupia sp. HS-3]|uniref:GGDEF domain-containing protein n=1 Tax=Jeongeupia sp. HS-3 TaxID=1009682 RepID=UPI0018A589C3|nr:GGDEF domain-containing protein [Jeongeupia sp. HS-3]BCL76342.1 hypothetical protein JHS3_20780 [Jeongeupia sp. HS-3]
MLETRWQLGWQDGNRAVIVALILIHLLLLAALLALVQRHQIRLRARHKETRRLNHLARHDPLTRLLNRHAFDLHLHALIETQQPCTLLFFDLNGFKAVNDRFGHDAGDHVLRTLAYRLQTHIRSDDLIARWGGDEFAQLIAEPLSASREAELIATLRTLLSRPVPWHEQKLTIGASIGVARFPHDGDTAEALLKAADRRMYKNKQARNLPAPVAS